MTSLVDGEVESATEMARALRAREVTAVDLMERALARAEAWQPAINAFSERWAEEATETARGIDASPARDRPQWAGVPVAVKDLYDVAGHRSTGCCAAYMDRLPAKADAPTVATLRRAGVAFIGKTNQHELAAGGTNLASVHGRTGNPWDPARITGGSSGGSAAAVAAGVVPWALGSDTGGSIRIPAALCGTFGLKPTYGRLPTDGLMPLAPSMDCPGPIAATAPDLRACYAAMGGPEAREQQPDRPAGSFRIGVPGGFFAEHVHRAVLDAVAGAASAFEGAGVAVLPLDGGGLESVRRVWLVECSVEFAAAHPLLKDPERRRLVDPQVVDWLETGERQTPEDRARAAVDRERVTRWFWERLEGVDALLIPTTPYPAFPADAREVDLGTGETVDVDSIGPGWLTSSVNLAGLPAVSLPAARSAAGLPIGVSLVGRANEEGLLLELAELWEATAGYRPSHPHPGDRS